MINSIIRYSLIFILLILLQVLLFNNIEFSGYINPWIYIMFILLLPCETASWLLLIIAFFTGFTVDMFCSTPGMHAAATVLAGFVRPYIMRLTAPRDGYEPGSDPSMAVYGFKWFLLYASMIVVVHHMALFYLEVFRFADFFRTLLRVLLSSLFSVSFILVLEYARKGR